MLKEKLLATTLTLTVFLAVFAVLRPAVSTEYIDVDDYCWIEGESIDFGFSKYGEMIGYDEETMIGLGIQYPGYESAGNTYDQTDDTSVDPFCNEYIGVDWWMNGWFIDIKYRTPAGVCREIWVFAMFSDGAQHGGDWIRMPSVSAISAARPLWQEYPPYANPDSAAYTGVITPIPEKGGRKTNGYCETEPIEIIYNGPRKFVALCKTTVGDIADLVALYFTFIFNKVEKSVIVLRDIERLYKKQPMNIQFGNRAQWDLGIAGATDSYTHWYTSEPVQYWDTDADGTINRTEVETTFELFKNHFLTHKHPRKWWDDVPEQERPTTVYNEWTEEMMDFPDEWLEAQETCYGREEHMDDHIKEHSYAVAQVISKAGDYVGALAVWPHPEFWSAANVFFPPERTVAPRGNNPSSIPLMLAPLSRMLEWHKWTVEEDPNQGLDDDLPDRDNIWVKGDDVRMPDGTTLEPVIPFIIYEHDFKLSSTLTQYRIASVYVLTDNHDGDDADADDPGNVEDWSNGVDQIDREIQYQLDEIFNPARHWWPMFRHDPRRTGYSTSKAPNTNNTIWNYTTGGSVYYSSPAVADGRVYVGSYDSNVYCLNASTGAYIWSYKTGVWVVSSPAVADGKVYVGSDDHRVYCLNASTGAYIWSYKTGLFVWSSPAVADGKVYVGSTDNNVYAFGPPPVHDVAVTDVTPSKTVVGQGYCMNITVAVENQGECTETFDVTVFYDANSIGTQVVTNLAAGASTTLTFTWDTTGVAYGNYTISSYATPVPGETDTADNTFVDGWVVITVPGDIDGNYKVDHKDLLLLARAYGSEVDDPNYIPEADINRDGKVDHKDLLILAKNYGKEK